MRDFSFLNFGRALLLILSFVLAGASAWADYEELSYEDLVNQLQQKKRRSQRASRRHAVDDLKIHLGVGLMTGIHRLDTPEGSSDRASNGFQLSAGIDLLSPEWVSEFVLRNFGTNRRHFDTHSLREVDLRVLHRRPLSDQFGFRLGGGLGTRYLRYSTASGFSRSDETPCVVAFGGLEAFVGPQVSLGAELGVRSPLIQRTMDKTSADLMVRLDTFF